MKVLNNTNLTLREALIQVIPQAMNSALQEQGVSSIAEIAKKPQLAKVVSNPGFSNNPIQLLGDDGISYNVNVFADPISISYEVDKKVELGFNADNEPYILRSYNADITHYSLLASTQIDLGIGTGDGTNGNMFGIKLENEKIILGPVTGDASYYGMVRVDRLVEELNNLRELFNRLVTQFNDHIHTTTATVGASTAPGVISKPTGSAAGNNVEYTLDSFQSTKFLIETE